MASQGHEPRHVLAEPRLFPAEDHSLQRSPSLGESRWQVAEADVTAAEPSSALRPRAFAVGGVGRDKKDCVWQLRLRVAVSLEICNPTVYQGLGRLKKLALCKAWQMQQQQQLDSAVPEPPS
ncbi:hypothetical protein LX36DRAFT_497489 [Colletotrichum falcatum]|nr:hypothetical protein LX36DRAFT_497489 [Colletotrichum falcatum]